jgi:hypothetical protein
MEQVRPERRFPLFLLAILLLFLVGCSSTVVVAVPPKIDLERHHTIGIVNFGSDPKDDLSQFATQKFMSIIQASQPNVRFLELGPIDRLLWSISRDGIDPETVRILGAKYNVDTIFTGAYEISRLRPQVRFGDDLSSVSASLAVRISFAVKHWDAKSGATLWTNSRSGQWSLARVGQHAGGPVSLKVSDPDDKYGRYIEQLVHAVTEDFQVHYERRRVARK